MSSERKILKARRRKKPDYINSLPEEVLCIIFDHLDLRSVKNASVTCQRWHSVIFLSGYIKRFGLYIYISSDCRNRTIKEFMDMVTNSQRCYRKLRWHGLHALEDNALLSVWEGIHPKLTNHLHSLHLCYTNSSYKLFPLVIEALPLMSELRTLKLWVTKEVCDTQEVIATLRSDFLKHLTIDSRVKYRLNMPQLQSLEGNLFACHLPDDSREAVALSSLKSLTVNPDNYTCEQRIAMPRSFFRQTRLERICWLLSLPNETFSLICETCTTLRELHFEPNPLIVNNLNSLSKLTNLRILKMLYSSMEIDLSTVLQLEEVQLYRIENVIKLPTSIRKLQVHVYDSNQLDMSHTILSASNQLTELLVEIEEEDKLLNTYAPHDILIALPHLKHLKVLKFHRGRFRKSSFLCMDAPLETLHQLHFERSNISSKRFLGLQEKFPNLKKLSFSNCGCWATVYELRSSSSMSFTESEEDSYDRSSDPMPITESEEDSDDRVSNSTSFTESDEDDQ